MYKTTFPLTLSTASLQLHSFTCQWQLSFSDNLVNTAQIALTGVLLLSFTLEPLQGCRMFMSFLNISISFFFFPLALSAAVTQSERKNGAQCKYPQTVSAGWLDCWYFGPLCQCVVYCCVHSEVQWQRSGSQCLWLQKQQMWLRVPASCGKIIRDVRTKGSTHSTSWRFKLGLRGVCVGI